MTIYGSRMVPRAIEGEEEGLANPKRRKNRDSCWERSQGSGVRSQEIPTYMEWNVTVVGRPVPKGSLELDTLQR